MKLPTWMSNVFDFTKTKVIIPNKLIANPIDLNSSGIRQGLRSLGRLGRLYSSQSKGDSRPELILEIEKCKHLLASEGFDIPNTSEEVESLQLYLAQNSIQNSSEVS